MLIDVRFRIAAGVVAAVIAVPLGASAQPSYATKGETITGTITSVQNVNHLFLADDRGYTDDVTLRAGASVISNGVRLVPGERVTLQGSAAGPTFLATRVTASGSPSYSTGGATSDSTAVAYPVPVPVYYPSAAYYAAPAVYAYIGFGPFAYYGYRPYYGGFYGGYYGRYYGGHYGGGYRGGYYGGGYRGGYYGGGYHGGYYGGGYHGGGYAGGYHAVSVGRGRGR